MTAAALLAVAALLTGCAAAGVGSAAPSGSNHRIVVHAGKVIGPFDRRLLGTNVPAWLSPAFASDQGVQSLIRGLGTTVLRLPGGSWSNEYDWLGCEMGDPNQCKWTWAIRPSDFLGLLQATGLPAIWTVSINGTAQEAAALVAFFNGSVDDNRPIGKDRNGRDWLTVGHWAQLRADHGHAAPVPIHSWEVGNEVYGAVKAAGSECESWGWENVWTCDGTEYAKGNADHDGFLQFRAAMRAVDSDIEVGAVGVGDRGAWSDWDNKVMKAAGDSIDFYVVHQYGLNNDVPPANVFALPRKAWPRITNDVHKSYADNGIDGDVPIAITEHNLIATIDNDNDQLMTQAVNAFYLAETLGQMASNGVEIANQWNLANGRGANGTDYGLIDAQTHQRSPAYYAMALWSRFGDNLVAVEADPSLAGLGIYGGRSADGSTQLIVINPNGSPFGATISLDPATRATVATADVVQAASLTSTSVTWNGVAEPTVGLTEPGQSVAVSSAGELHQDFPAYSITLLRWKAGS